MASSQVEDEIILGQCFRSQEVLTAVKGPLHGGVAGFVHECSTGQDLSLVVQAWSTKRQTSRMYRANGEMRPAVSGRK